MFRATLAAMLTAVLIQSSSGAFAADDYTIDPSHTDVSFKISHLGLSRILGRFDDVAGTFTIDPQSPAKSFFAMTIKTESIDTNQKQRDEHLRSPDFFDVAKFPEIQFVTTSAKAVPGGIEVTGNFTLRGVTKPLTMKLVGGGAAEFPQGVHRTGYTTDLVLKRSDFGMTTFLGPVGDEVTISISFEGIKK